jgi:hypothetical protein
MALIQLRNINTGGIANSKYQGIANSMATIVALDIHSEPGVIKVNQKLTKESGSIVVDFIIKSLPCSDGNTYFFGDTGKVYKRTSAGVWTLACTAAPAAGAVKLMDAIEDQGYIYYTMPNRVGRVAVGAPVDWATRDDNWATFTNTDADFHPMTKVNLVVYIGDKNFVAQIEDGVFTANALDIKSPLRIKALGGYDTELLLGTYVNDNINQTEIYRWNTWSVSFTNSDPIPEKGINSFLKIDNATLVNVGEKGNLYLYDGSRLLKSKRVPGDWGIGKKALVKQDASEVYNIPLFGLSAIYLTSAYATNPCVLGIYGLGNYNPDYAPVLTIEYIPSHGKTSGVEIGSIIQIDDYILVSWKDGTNYGVDVLDATAKATLAYTDTRYMFPDRSGFSTIQPIIVPYRSLPTGTSIEIWQSKNYGTFEKMDTVIDVDKKIVKADVDILDVITLQIKAVLVASGNTAPEIEGIDIPVEEHK